MRARAPGWGRSAHSAKQIDEELKLQIPLYMLVLRDLVEIEPLGGVYRALAGARVTRGLLSADAADDLPGLPAPTLPRSDAFWGLVDTARERALGYAQPNPRRRHSPRSEGRHVPHLVRPLDDVPRGATVNPEQRAAVAPGGRVPPFGSWRMSPAQIRCA